MATRTRRGKEEQSQHFLGTFGEHFLVNDKG